MHSRSLTVNPKGNCPLSFWRCLYVLRASERWFYKWHFPWVMNSLHGLIYLFGYLCLLCHLCMPGAQAASEGWVGRKEVEGYHHPALICETMSLSVKFNPCHVYRAPHSSSLNQIPVLPVYATPSLSHCWARPNACSWGIKSLVKNADLIEAVMEETSNYPQYFRINELFRLVKREQSLKGRFWLGVCYLQVQNHGGI